MPLPLWYKQRLHQTRRLLMFNLKLLTNQTSINKLCYILLIHLHRFLMNTQTTPVTFFQNPLLKLMYIRYTNSATKHQNTIHTQSEVHSFTLINQHQAIHKFQFLFLTSFDFLQNITRQLQHSKLHTSWRQFTHQTQIPKLFNKLQLFHRQLFTS